MESVDEDARHILFPERQSPGPQPKDSDGGWLLIHRSRGCLSTACQHSGQSGVFPPPGLTLRCASYNSALSFHLLQQSRVFPSNPEPASTASLARQLVWRMPGLCLLGLELQAGSQPCRVIVYKVSGDPNSAPDTSRTRHPHTTEEALVLTPENCWTIPHPYALVSPPTRTTATSRFLGRPASGAGDGEMALVHWPFPGLSSLWTENSMKTFAFDSPHPHLRAIRMQKSITKCC